MNSINQVPLGNLLSDRETREKLREEIYLSIGGGMIDIELTPEHYDLAITKAIDRYRTRSTHAVEESFIFLEVQPEVSEYILPPEVMDVRNVFRRGSSGNTAGGTFFDPFSAALVNSIYSIPYLSGSSGNLVLYDAAIQYQELVGKMFGLYLLWTWNTVTKKILFHRKFAAPEQVVIWAYNYKPEAVLFANPSIRQWIRNYAIAAAKYMLGEARSFINSLPGPAGQISLNGDKLKDEAIATMETLEKEIVWFADGTDQGLGFIIG